MFVVESWSIDSFAGWYTCFKLLNRSNCGDDTSDSFSWIFGLNGCFELSDSSIKHKKRFILVTNACQKGIEIKFTSKSLENSLIYLCELIFISRFSKLGRTEESFGSSISNISSESFPVLLVVGIDRIFNLMVDAYTVK